LFPYLLIKQDDTSNLPAIKKKLNILKNDAFSWPKTEVSTGIFLFYRSTVEVSTGTTAIFTPAQSICGFGGLCYLTAVRRRDAPSCREV
jgi:hypothetical protein